MYSTKLASVNFQINTKSRHIIILYLLQNSWPVWAVEASDSAPLSSVVCQSYRLWDCTSTPVRNIITPSSSGSSTRPISFNHSQHHCLHQPLIFHSACVTNSFSFFCFCFLFFVVWSFYFVSWHFCWWLYLSSTLSIFSCSSASQMLGISWSLLPS